MHGIVDIIKSAPRDKVDALKAKLLNCCDKADQESGWFNKRWKLAIEKLDSEPEKVLDCNSILHDLIAEALGADQNGG